VLIVFMLLVLAVVISSPRPAQRLGSSTITVGAGDTLWSIAAAHPVDGMSTSQVSSLVASMNDLSQATIHPGDTLKVPVPVGGGDSYAMR
jgi:LysM repeat protein